MSSPILGLDIGGANLKAATPDRYAASLPFALWQAPERLPETLAILVAQFPATAELAVTMTGELCDCYATKQAGVAAILEAVRLAAAGRPVRVWSTAGGFLDPDQARRNHLLVASANWHALATLAGQLVPQGPAILLDIGSTTTDIIPLCDGQPIPLGRTDPERLASRELLYTGYRRTPILALMGVADQLAAELFATTLDVYLHLGLIAEQPTDTDTADGRPATRAAAFDRLCRMYCGDRETVPATRIDALAAEVLTRQLRLIAAAFAQARQTIEQKLRQEGREGKQAPAVVVSGAGEMVWPRLVGELGECGPIVSLGDRFGPVVSACAPAFAVAVLASTSGGSGWRV
jgi:probable H4MPT-linked C1 transfer pathway protein